MALYPDSSPPNTKVLCPMSESLSGKREGFQDNTTHEKGSLLLTRVRVPAASNAVVRGQRAPSPSCYTNLYGEHKQLVVGLSGLVTCLQSNFIGPNFCRPFFKPGHSRAFQLFPIDSLFLTGRILIGWLQVAWWGYGILPFWGKSKLRSGPPIMVLALAASHKASAFFLKYSIFSKNLPLQMQFHHYQVLDDQLPLNCNYKHILRPSNLQVFCFHILISSLLQALTFCLLYTGTMKKIFCPVLFWNQNPLNLLKMSFM